MPDTIPVTVEVTFLRMEAPPADPAPPLPDGVGVLRLPRPTVGFYRYLYDTVGRDYCWWLRRTVSDGRLGRILADPAVSIHVLYRDGEPAGFYELERRPDRTINLGYFGLMPHVIGAGLGRPFLRDAVDTAWAERPDGLTVNTCTADHPRAMPNYLAAGFTVTRRVREEWPIPAELDLRLPASLPPG
ncbi:GNAT family N-acetyltransferase [Roseomonas sp. CCTCC AB2023176]|uniref:GNAT family N-acetyltransferase n=1 Tax=Roseomonas sp. CCTCC AB2023176 TaxID=3342640 RepID=UPI0035D61894